MLTRRLPVVLAAAAALVLTSAPAASAHPPAKAQRQVTVASYNLFLGGDIEPLLTAGAGLPAAAATLWQQVAASDFPARAQAIAELLDEDDPDVVGLQEVALWEVSASATGAPLGSLDFLDTLLAALHARGAHYSAVATSTNIESPPVPLGNGTSVSYTDRDVILVRTDLPTSRLRVVATDDGTYDAGIPFSVALPGAPSAVELEVVRGWALADVKVRGKTFRFVNTHLEAFDPPPLGASVRNAQAAELAALLDDSPHPVVLVGDLNDDPAPDAGAREVLVGGLGLSDAWALGNSSGFTSGQDLFAAAPEFDRRIDYVLYEGDRRPSLRALESHLVGEEPQDRTATGLWPSDHAGVVATLLLARP